MSATRKSVRVSLLVFHLAKSTKQTSILSLTQKYRDLSPPEILTGSVPFDPDDGQVDADGLLMELENKWKPIFEKLDDGKSGKTYPAVRLAILR